MANPVVYDAPQSLTVPEQQQVWKNITPAAVRSRTANAWEIGIETGNSGSQNISALNAALSASADLASIVFAAGQYEFDNQLATTNRNMSYLGQGGRGQTEFIFTGSNQGILHTDSSTLDIVHPLKVSGIRLVASTANGNAGTQTGIRVSVPPRVGISGVKGNYLLDDVEVSSNAGTDAWLIGFHGDNVINGQMSNVRFTNHRDYATRPGHGALFSGFSLNNEVSNIQVERHGFGVTCSPLSITACDLNSTTGLAPGQEIIFSNGAVGMIMNPSSDLTGTSGRIAVYMVSGAAATGTCTVTSIGTFTVSAVNSSRTYGGEGLFVSNFILVDVGGGIYSENDGTIYKKSHCFRFTNGHIDNRNNAPITFHYTTQSSVSRVFVVNYVTSGVMMCLGGEFNKLSADCVNASGGINWWIDAWEGDNTYNAGACLELHMDVFQSSGGTIYSMQKVGSVGNIYRTDQTIL